MLLRRSHITFTDVWTVVGWDYAPHAYTHYTHVLHTRVCPQDSHICRRTGYAHAFCAPHARYTTVTFPILFWFDYVWLPIWTVALRFYIYGYTLPVYGCHRLPILRLRLVTHVQRGHLPLRTLPTPFYPRTRYCGCCSFAVVTRYTRLRLRYYRFTVYAFVAARPRCPPHGDCRVTFTTRSARLLPFCRYGYRLICTRALPGLRCCVYRASHRHFVAHIYHITFVAFTHTLYVCIATHICWFTVSSYPIYFHIYTHTVYITFTLLRFTLLFPTPVVVGYTFWFPHSYFTHLHLHLVVCVRYGCLLRLRCCICVVALPVIYVCHLYGRYRADALPRLFTRHFVAALRVLHCPDYNTRTVLPGPHTRLHIYVVPPHVYVRCGLCWLPLRGCAVTSTLVPTRSVCALLRATQFCARCVYAHRIQFAYRCLCRTVYLRTRIDSGLGPVTPPAPRLRCCGYTPFCSSTRYHTTHLFFTRFTFTAAHGCRPITSYYGWTVVTLRWFTHTGPYLPLVIAVHVAIHRYIRTRTFTYTRYPDAHTHHSCRTH